MVNSPKPYRLSFIKHSQYIEAELSADRISEEILRGFVSEIAAECKATGIKRVLFYRDLPAVLDAEASATHGNWSVKQLRGIRVAIINPYEQFTSEIRTGVADSQSRGADFATFTDIAEAKAWLIL